MLTTSRAAPGDAKRRPVRGEAVAFRVERVALHHRALTIGRAACGAATVRDARQPIEGVERVVAPARAETADLAALGDGGDVAGHVMGVSERAEALAERCWGRGGRTGAIGGTIRTDAMGQREQSPRRARRRRAIGHHRACTRGQIEQCRRGQPVGQIDRRPPTGLVMVEGDRTARGEREPGQPVGIVVEIGRDGPAAAAHGDATAEGVVFIGEGKGRA